MPSIPIEPVLTNFNNFIEIMLVHWPGIQGLKHSDPENEIKRHAYYAELEDLKQNGFIGEIGVSNFNSNHLIKLLKVCKIKPAFNQFELHPLFIDRDTIKVCRENDI